ncbi:phosphoribosylglycinamide formyltransferase [soil metagenome]
MTMPRDHKPGLAVMISGGGRTLVNIADAVDRGALNARIVLVIASAECAGAVKARQRGIDTRVIPGVIPRAELERVLQEANTDFVALAGYLKLVEVPAPYRGRMLNIHPALLPHFGGPGMYGRRVHEAVLKAGDRESGCTVHVVDDEFDHGAIILQRRCPVLEGDTAETLAARVFETEKGGYIEGIRRLVGLTRGELPRNRSS